MEAIRGLPASGRLRKLRAIADEHAALLETMERYWIALTDRGWGVANVGVDVIRTAGSLLSQGAEEAADATIASWFNARWNERTIARVAFMTDGTAAGRLLFEHRSRLLREAGPPSVPRTLQFIMCRSLRSWAKRGKRCAPLGWSSLLRCLKG